MAHDCFISYSHRDIHLARQLSEALAKKGIRAWWDPELRPAVGPWLKHVLQAMGDSKALVVIVSSNSAEREEVNNEVGFAKQNRKPVIPVFAGEVPTDAELFYSVQRYQRVSTAFSAMEERAVEEIVFKLKNIVPDPTPVLALDKLSLGDKDIPRLDSLDTALHRACYRHFVHSVKNGDFAEAEQVLQDIKNRHIPVRSPEQFEALQVWSRWTNWYEKTQKNLRTWGELVKSLEKGLPSKVASPAAFQSACPPVASRLASEWWRILNKVFEDFLSFITTAAWSDEASADSARILSPLDPTLLRPIAPLIDGVESLNAPDEKSLSACARQVLELYIAAPLENSATFEALIQDSFPPSEQELLDSQKIWNLQTAQMKSLQQFVELLEGVVSRCDGSGSSAHELLKTIKGTRGTSESTKNPTEFDETLRLRRLWDSSLGDMVSANQGRQLLELAEPAMLEAGRVFAHAQTHAGLIRAYREAASDYEQSTVAGNPWPEIIECLANYDKAVEKLLEGVVSPLLDHWKRESDNRSKKAESFSQHLASAQKDLQRRRRMLMALEQLRAGDLDFAREALKGLVHDDPAVAPLAGPWIEVCEMIGPLYAVAGGGWQSLLDPNTGLPTVAFLMESSGKPQLKSILAAAENAEAAFRKATQTGFPLKEISLPAQGTIVYLTCLTGFLKDVERGDWHSAERKITAYITDAADPVNSAFTLLTAVRTLAEVPSFFSLESVLTAPVTNHRAGSSSGHALNVSQANMAALLAVLGQFEAVGVSLTSHSDHNPHNLGVAVFSAIRRNHGQVASRHLALAMASCALFACSEKYREFLAQAYAPLTLPSLGKGAKLRESVGSQLKKCFELAGAEWGALGDSQSWACQWEVECFAVSQMSSQDSCAPLPWPFGPTLVQFYELRRELGEVLKRKPALRVWYGPCAAGEAMNFSREPASALQSLPRVETCTAEQAQASLGYAAFPDPLAALQNDVNSTRCNVLILLLGRNLFNPDTPPSEGPNIQIMLITHSRELLELRERGAAVDESFIRALNDVFTRMVEQLEEPLLHLRRAATIEDAEARKKCMDGVLEFLNGLPNREWLTVCIRTLRSFRSDVSKILVDLKSEQWQNAGKPAAILAQMLALAEDAIRDDPNDANTKILKIRTLLLEGVEALPKVEAYLKSVQSSASVLDWPAWAAKEVQRLIRKVSEKQEQDGLEL